MTDRSLARGANPSAKVVTDRELFGVTVPNPYPDNEDEESLKKYRAVRDQLDQLIDANLDKILDRAGARPLL